MAWVNGRSWDMEQGIDALLEFRMFANTAKTEPWDFTGWAVTATVSDEKARNVWPVTVDADPSGGVLRLIFPEALVNTLRIGKTYRYDALMVAPGADPADDHVLAAGPVTVALRSTRREEG